LITLLSFNFTWKIFLDNAFRTKDIENILQFCESNS